MRSAVSIPSPHIALAGIAAVLALAAHGVAHADPAADEPTVSADSATGDSTGDGAGGGRGGSSISEYFAHWYDRVDEARASQPNWITPLATVTPRLEESFRFDFLNQQLGDGATVNNYDGGKGLELIPTTSTEVRINLPPYLTRTGKDPASGFNDWPFLTIKQRFISANAENGAYIVTGVIGVQAPTGIAKFTNDAWVITPTLAAGKGWGPFDIQATVGVPIPLEHESTIGTSLVSNTTFQYHLGEVFWPEFEVNLTHWYDGHRAGKTQVFLTPGIVFGRFPISNRVKLIFGVGYQFAVSPTLTLKPVLTPVYNHALIAAARVAF
jgi:hypothetical protein